MYKLVEADLEDGKKFPYTALLQLRWESRIQVKGYTRLKDLITLYKAKKIDFAELHYRIYMSIVELRTEHPEEFPEPGWWDKKNAKIATRDRISPTSKLTKLSKQVNICKICGGYLAEIKYYTAVQIEGEYWVVHKKCIKAYSDEIKEKVGVI